MLQALSACRPRPLDSRFRAKSDVPAISECRFVHFGFFVEASSTVGRASNSRERHSESACYFGRFAGQTGVVSGRFDDILECHTSWGAAMT